MVTRSNGDFSHTLTASETFKFIKPGTVKIKVTYNFLNLGYRVINAPTYSPEKIITIQVKPADITATFDSAGGSKVANQTITSGSNIKEPEKPTRSGYEFIGRYQGNTKFDFSKPVTSNITLTAKWDKLPDKPTEFTVNFDSAGGSKVSSQTVTSGSNAKEPGKPTRSGYEFIGWYQGSTKFDFSKPVTSNITLTAKWEKLEIKVTSVELNKSSIKLKVGQSYKLTATVKPADAADKALTWSTSNSKVATVDSTGKISAKAAGTAVITITAKNNGKIQDKCQITVEKKSTSSSKPKIKLNKTSAKITMNGSTQLKLNGASGKVTWKSSSSSVAAVSSKGKVTGKKPGRVTISATSGGKRYKCTVTVVPQKQKITFAKNQKSKSVTLKWRKVKGVKGYMIAYTTDKNFKKGVKTATITRYSTYKKTITRLQKNKTYYFKVKSFGTYKGQRLYGAYSNVVKVKIRK
mgnify:CR=1 FL=1